MSPSPEWPPTPASMHALLPAFEFTAMVTSNDLGAVFFAKQKSLDRQVAVKVFSPALGADDSFRGAFENSSKLAAGLRHTNLIGILDSGRAGSMPYLVMEFVPGKSLARSTRGQIVEFNQSVAIIDAICAGLAHAHEAGLVHGHLDTLSVLLNQNAVPKIGNFGLGRIVHTDPETKAPRHYIAPEVLVDPATATIQSDVFSVAAIFHELITGQPYGPGSPPASTLCGCRPGVDPVLRRATDPDPGKRFEDAAAFQSALAKAAAGPLAKAAAAPAAAAPAAAGTPAKSAHLHTPKSGFDSKLLTKLVIIVILLFAIFFTWETLKKTRADREKENQEILANEKARKDKQVADQAGVDKQIEDVKKLRIPTAPAKDRPVYEKQPETPEESLARLRTSLASGTRSEMPVGSVKKGDREYFLVEQPMTWAEASLFAEEHGAHLADPGTELGWLSEKLTKDREYWLGAARSGGDSWVLCDGKPWSPSENPKGNGLFLIAARTGGFASADEGQPRPFVIEWHADGSNPGSLTSLLAATRSSLESDSPLFPPGTVISGERRYLFVPRPVAWKEACELAEDGGGHLIVAASSEEIGELNKMTRRIKAREGIWLGGSLEDDHWQWVTGELWEAAAWADESDASEEGSALAILPGKGWIAMDRDDTASGFLIEWSEDKDAPKPDTTAPAPGDKIAELNARVKELVLAAGKKRDADLASNAKKLLWDLDSFVRNLAGSGQEKWKPHVEAVKECVKNDRVIIDDIRERGISVSVEMAKLINYCAGKEAEYDARLEADCTKIRDAYVAKLAAIRDEAKAAGQPKVATDAADAIDGAEDLRSWLEPYNIEFSKPKAAKVTEFDPDSDDDDDDRDDFRKLRERIRDEIEDRD